MPPDEWEETAAKKGAVVYVIDFCPECGRDVERDEELGWCFDCLEAEIAAEQAEERLELFDRVCVHGMSAVTCVLEAESVVDRADRWDKLARARKDVGSCDRCGHRLCSCGQWGGEVTPCLSHEVPPIVVESTPLTGSSVVVIEAAEVERRLAWFSQYGAIRLYRGIEFDAGLHAGGVQERDVTDETWIPESPDAVAAPYAVPADAKERRRWVPTLRGAASTLSNV